VQRREAEKEAAMQKVLAAPKVPTTDPLADQDLSRIRKSLQGQAAAPDAAMDDEEDISAMVCKESRLGLYNNKKKNRTQIAKKKRASKMLRLTKVKKARKHGLMNVKMDVG